MKEKQKNILIFISMILIIIIAGIILKGNNYSVITSTYSIIPLEYEGVTKDYIGIATNLNDNLVHTLNFQVAERSDGIYKYTPENPTIKMEIQKVSEVCAYQTQSQILSYTIGTAQPDVKVDINLDGNKKTISLTDSQDNIEVKSTRNGGTIYVQINGLKTKSNCPDMSNTLIYNVNNKYYLVNRDNKDKVLTLCVAKYSSPILGFFINCDIDKMKDNLVYSEIKGDIQFDKSVLIVSPKKSLGALDMDIKADAEIFAFKSEIINKIAKPEIQDLTCGDTAEGQKGSMAVTIKDSLKTGNIINVIPTSDEVTFIPSNIESQEGTFYFTMTGKDTDVKKNINILVTAKACDVGNCNIDTETFSKCSLLESGSKSTCGDNICQTYENINSCSQDCSSKCEKTETYSAILQKCVCSAGYELDEKSGTCQEPKSMSWSLFIITLIIGLIGAWMVYAVTTPLKDIKTNGIAIGTIIRWSLMIFVFIIIFLFIPNFVKGIISFFTL